jgi:hypothetical protein
MADITYQEVYDAIKTALLQRAPGSKVQVPLHEVAEMKLLTYIEQLKQATPVSNIRESHKSALAGVNCAMVWNLAFPDTNYTYTINGFDGGGNPVEIYLVSKSATNIIVKTLVNATLTALARPHQLQPEH